MNSPPLPPENIYGHTAKLCFFLAVLDRLRSGRSCGLRILDVGCGNGWAVTRYLGKDGDHVLGIDLHEPSVNYARDNFGHGELEFRCLSAESLSETSMRWDVIVLADVLEHLDDPSKVLRTCKSLLAEGGRLLVSIPNGYGISEIERALSRVPLLGPGLLKLIDLIVAVLNKFIFKGLWTKAMEALPRDIPYNHDSPHVQFRSERSWVGLFELQGFLVRSRQNLACFAGPFSNYIFGASQRFVTANTWISRQIPSVFSSNWAFELSALPSKVEVQSITGEVTSECPGLSGSANLGFVSPDGETQAQRTRDALGYGEGTPLQEKSAPRVPPINGNMLRDVTLTLATRVVLIAVGLITSIITARALGVTGRGEYFYIVTLASLATQIANLGLPSSNTYALAKDQSLLPRLAGNSFWVSVVVGLFAVCCILIFEADQTQLYWLDGPVLLLILMVPTMLYGLLASNLFIGMSMIRRYNLFQLFSNIVQLVLVTGAAWMALGVGGFLMVSAFTGLAAGGLLMVMLGSIHKLSWQFDWRLLRVNIGYAGRAYIATLLMYGVNRAGVLLLDHFSGKGEIGIYSVAIQFADVLIVFPSTVAMVLFPNLLKGPIGERFSSTMRTTMQVAIVMAFFCIFTGFAAKWIVPTLFGAAFGSAVYVLWWMLPGVFAWSLASVISQYIAAKGRPLAHVWSWVGGLVFLLAIGAQIIPRWGALGAAVSLSLTYIFLTFALFIIAIRQSAMEPQSGTQ